MKKPFKIFITGAGGQLAKSFSEIYPKEYLYLAGRQTVDITNKKQVISEITNARPDIIFHFASMTRGDDCVKNPKEAYKVNVVGTRNIVVAAKKIDCQLLFVSTNEVFDGNKSIAYTERDNPNPITIVGKTKYKAENIIKKNLKKYYIVRTSWLYSKWSENFLQAIFRKANKIKKVSLVSDEVSSPTHSQDLAGAVKKLILTGKFGTYHVTNSGMASRFEFGAEAFAICKIMAKIIPVTLDNYKRASIPPKFTPLNGEKLEKLGIKMPSWKSSLLKFLKSQNYKL